MRPDMLARPAPQVDAASEPAVWVEFDVPCQRLGLTRPPQAVHLTFVQARGYCTVLVWSDRPDLPALSKWLAPLGARSMQSHENATVRGAWFDLETLPSALDGLLAHLHVRGTYVRADGRAVVTARGTASDVRRWTAMHHDGADAPLVRIVEPRDPGESYALSERQKHVLAGAFAKGYYDVPRGTELRALARALDVSASTVCEVLRRAEAKVVEAFLVDSGLAPVSVDVEISARRAVD